MKHLHLLLAALPLLLLTGAIALAGAPRSRADIGEAVHSLEVRADSGNADALWHLARLAERGYDSIPADTARAVALYRRAAELGDARAQNYYGFMLFEGRGMPRDRNAALRWMEKAAVGGDLTAANNLGWLLLEGEGIERNDSNAAYWLARAADGGMPQAMSMLADLCRNGRGTPRDTLRAISLYNRAIEAGLADARLKLLDMQRLHWESLSPDSALTLGLYYYTHRAPDLGVHLFSRAARGGNPRAMALMGDAASRALGIPYDHDAALRWYLRAARAGDPSAAFVLAELLEFFPDAFDALPDAEAGAEEKKAAYWAEKAARGGITDAATATRRLLGN